MRSSVSSRGSFCCSSRRRGSSCWRRRRFSPCSRSAAGVARAQRARWWAPPSWWSRPYSSCGSRRCWRASGSSCRSRATTSATRATSWALAIACLVVTGGMVVVAIRLRDRLLLAVAVTQAALVASMLHNTEPHHVAVNSFPLVVFVPLAAAAPRGTAPRGATTRKAVGGRDDGDRRRRVRAVRGRDAAPAGRCSSRARCTSTSSGAPRATSFPSRAWRRPTRSTPGRSCPGCTTRSASRIRSSSSETVVCNGGLPAAPARAARRRSGPRSRSSHYDMVRHLGYDENNPVDALFPRAATSPAARMNTRG